MQIAHSKDYEIIVFQQSLNKIMTLITLIITQLASLKDEVYNVYKLSETLGEDNEETENFD